jgi:penicillin-binding protein 1A
MSEADHPAPQGFFARMRWRRLLLIGGALTALAVTLLIAFAILTLPATPAVDDLQRGRNYQPSVLLSADGKKLGSFRTLQRAWVDLDRISPHLVKALVATEDHRFYEHRGIDPRRIFAATFHTIGGDTQGASTITQQLARNMFPEEIGRSRTMARKLKEILTALKIEQTYSKKQILETYLNTVPFLYNVTGIEMAARTYFSKPAAELDVAESAMLVGMLKGTHYYNPVVNPERALKRRNIVLAQMVKHALLLPADGRSLQAQPLNLRFRRQVEQFDDSAPHFTAYVRRWLASWAEQNDIDLSSDGLVIETTLDMTLQQAATRAVEAQAQALQQVADVEWGQRSERLLGETTAAYAKQHKKVEPFDYLWRTNTDLVDAFIRETPEFKKALAAKQAPAAALAELRADGDFMARLKATKTRLEAGFMAQDPTTGEIKAWVGSRDFDRDQFDHVAQAARQPGSTFKPIVYGAALEQGLAPDHIYEDRQIVITAPDGSQWRPTDMSGPTFQRMTLRDGLVYSKNTITAQVMQDVGLPNIINLAQAVGINRSRLDPVPSLALGTSPVTLFEMVSAYSTIATAGEYRKPVFIRRITDRDGRVLAEFSSVDANQPRRVMTRESAIELIDMMRGVVSMGTGQMVKTRFGIVADIAGKTGTTQNNTDGWFILMHPRLVAGAWVGFNDARVTMRSEYWGQGGHNATLLVGDFFRDALKANLIDRKARFDQPKRPTLVASRTLPADANANIVEPGTGVIVRSDGTSTVIDASESAPRSGLAKTFDSLGRFLSGAARSATDGAQSSGTSSGTSSVRDGGSKPARRSDPWDDVPNSTR